MLESLNLYGRLRQIFIKYTIIVMVMVTIIFCIVGYYKEKQKILHDIKHKVDMFINLSENFLNKYNDSIIPISKKLSMLDERINSFFEWSQLINDEDNFFILKKGFVVSATSSKYKGMLNFDMSRIDFYKKRPVSDVYQSLFTGKSVVANIYDLPNGSLLIIERDLSYFIPIVNDFMDKYFSPESFFFILDGNGEVIYHPDKKLMESRHNLGFELEKKFFSIPFSDLKMIIINNNLYLSFSMELNKPKGWELFFLVSYAHFVSSILMNVLWQILIVLTALFVLSIVIKRFIDSDVTKPFMNISNFLGDIKSIEDIKDIPIKKDYKVKEFQKIIEVVEGMITNIKDSYEMISRNEEKFRLLSDFSPVWIYWIDSSGNFVYMSPAAEKITGYEIKDFMDDPSLMEKIINSSDRMMYEEHHKIVMKKGEDIPIEYRIMRRDGETRWIRHICKKIYNIKGEFLGIRGSNIDITLRKDYELQLIQQKELLYITLESIGEAVISTNKDGRIVNLNKEAQRLTEWTKEDAVGRDLQEVFQIIHEETLNPLPSPVEIVLKKNEVVNLSNKTVLLSKSGKKYVIADSAAPIIDNDGNITGVVMVFRDETAKKIFEAESLKASKLDSLSVLAGGIAHDFNNILTAIIGNISLCKYLIDEGSKIYKKLDIAERAAEKAKDLVAQLMTFAKGSMPVKKNISIKTLINDLVNFLLSGSNAIAEVDIDDDIWNVYADEVMITQVIHNILINAEQAMPTGGKVTIKAENVIINVNSTIPLNPGRYVKISISDTGIGIPKATIDKVFDPYYTTKAKGTGLGLASAYSIIKRHDGHIEIDSKIGVGTNVYIYIPASLQKSTEVVAQDKIEIDLKGKVLFMDDDVNVFEVGKEILNNVGMDVIHARDGLEAIKIYQDALNKDEPFDLIILDITIPGGMGGKDTIKRLFEIDSSVKAIVISGYSEDIVMSDYKDYGFSGVLRKPFDFRKMISEVKKVLNN